MFPGKSAIAVALMAAVFSAPAALAQDAGSLMRQADAAKAAGRSNDAVKLYHSAAEAFAKAGNQSAAADAFEKEADILIAQSTAPAAAKPSPPAQPPVARAPVAPPVQAAPPVQTKGALPDGLYNCHGIGTNTIYAVIGRVAIKGNSYVYYTENDREKLAGSYSWNGGKNIVWTSGFLKGKSDATWENDGVTKDNMLTVYTTAKNALYARALICYHSDMTPP